MKVTLGEAVGTLLTGLGNLGGEIVAELEIVAAPIEGLTSQLTVFQTSLMQFQGDVGPVIEALPEGLADIQDSIDAVADTLDAVGNLLNEVRQGIDIKLQDQNQMIVDAFAAQTVAFESRLSEVEAGCSSQNADISNLQGSINEIIDYVSTFKIEREACQPFGGKQADNGDLVCCLSSCSKCDDTPVCRERAGGAHECCVTTIRYRRHDVTGK
eukprot:TRINITY_DN1506_c0_g1_i1.p1 TRINITY_DN1506_c0_g1~~TRINITY_DN1506_c0_g1_i1.p1  ORF type:complete len:213 (-),score=45.04 TRINITY_DN1506_c0_g1_i1:167-805(-)